MTVVSTIPNSPNQELHNAIVLKIFSSIGRCLILDEKHFDACTALSGSGPAFACIFLEAMADGGVMMGLPRSEALQLASQSNLCCAAPLVWKRLMFFLQLCKALPVWSFKPADTLLRLKTL